MYLDLKTLQLAAIVVCCVLGPVSLAFAPAQRFMQPSRFWGAGLIALAVGLALSSLHGHVADLVSQVLGGGLFALALSFAQLSARSASGREGRDVPGLVLLATFVVLLLVLNRLPSLAWLQTSFYLGALGLLSARVAIGFDESKGLAEGRPLRTIGGIFGIFATCLLLQCVLALTPADPDALLGTEMTDALFLVGLIAGVLLGTILLMWVMTERINSRVLQLVSLDPLTGALNRSAFIQQFEREVSRTRRRSVAQFGILLIDIDRFHRVNTGSGNMAGDRLLEKTVELLRGMSREYDVIGRLEGDVFVLLTPGAGGEAAMRMAERIRREFEQQAAKRAGLSNSASVSIGIALFGENGESWDVVLHAAENALKQAKAAGRNRVELAVQHSLGGLAAIPAASQ